VAGRRLGDAVHDLEVLIQDVATAPSGSAWPARGHDHQLATGHIGSILLLASATEPETDGGAVSAGANADAGEETDQQSIIDAGESPECPECGALSLYYSEGCKTCESCGWSEC